MNFETWKNTLKEWAHRPELTDATVTTIETLVRARLGRELRLKENTVSLNITVPAAGYTLPAYIKEIQHVQSQDRRYNYTYVTPEQIPVNENIYLYSIEGAKLYLSKGADVTIIYFREPEQLAGSSNPVSAQWPNIYLYAGLVEVARYYQDTEMLQFFDQQYNIELKRANDQAQRERIGNAPAMRAI